MIKKSGYFGVYWHPLANKYCVQIRNGKQIEYLGLFSTAELAARAYDVVAKRLGKKNLNFPS